MEEINEQKFINELSKNINNNIKVNINGSIVTTLQLIFGDGGKNHY